MFLFVRLVLKSALGEFILLQIFRYIFYTGVFYGNFKTNCG